MKSYLSWLFRSAFARNAQNILASVADVRASSVLDLGCDDGAWTMRVAGAAHAVRAGSKFTSAT